MKLIVALAAVLSSAMLTVPTVTQVGSTANDVVADIVHDAQAYA
ncbi:MAG: hypothetical protein ABI412_02495 [Sphingomicrobium sp.]